MGYFSSLAQEYADYDLDRSYPSPEKQLLYRLDDLNTKREKLIKADAPYRNWTRLTDTDIRYAIPEHLDTIADVERAIELVVEDLRCNYEIDILGEGNNKTTGLSEVTDEQISLFDSIPLSALSESLKAA